MWNCSTNSVCYIPDMGTGSTMSQRQLLPPAPALTSLHTVGRAALLSSCAGGCCLHGSAQTWTNDLFQITLPCFTSPSTSGSLSQAWDHLAPRLMEASDFAQGSTKSLLTVTAETRDERAERHFPVQQQEQPPFTGCWPDAFQGASGPLSNTRSLNSLTS